MRCSPRRFFGFLLALIAAGCGGKSTAPDTAPAAVVARRPPPPDGVVAIVATSSLTAAATGVGAFVGERDPSATAAIGTEMALALAARWVGAESLSGLDAGAPMLLVVAERPLPGSIVLGRARDAKALVAAAKGAVVVVHDGWAAVGPAASVEALAPWARGELAAHEPTMAIEGEVYADALIARHRGELAMAQAGILAGSAANPSMAALMPRMVEAMRSLGGDIERVVVRGTVSGGSLELDLALAPRAGSRLASFTAAQQPSQFGLLGSLPADAPGGYLMAGRFALGPYRDAWLELMGLFMNLGNSMPTWMQAFGRLGDLATGEVAATGSFGVGGVAMHQIIAVSDAGAAEAVVREIAGAIGRELVVETMGIRAYQRPRLDVARHEGLAIHQLETTIDLTSIPAEQRPMMEAMYKTPQRYLFGFPPGAIVMASGDVAAAARSIDAVRGKGARLAVSQATERFLGRARERKESLVMLMDLGAIMSNLQTMIAGGVPASASKPPAPGLVFALGGQGGALHVRLMILGDTFRGLKPGG